MIATSMSRGFFPPAYDGSPATGATSTGRSMLSVEYVLVATPVMPDVLTIDVAKLPFSA